MQPQVWLCDHVIKLSNEGTWIHAAGNYDFPATLFMI